MLTLDIWDLTSEKVTGHDQAPIADTVMPMATRPPVAAPVRRLSGENLRLLATSGDHGSNF